MFLADLDKDNEVSLQTIINAWNKILKELESQGCRVTKGPHFNSGSYYGRSISISYTYEWDNLNYSVEQAEYELAIANYEQEMITWKEFEEDRKNTLKAGIKNIDAQITRAEHRLANLKAHKAGEPLPYPEG